MYKIIHFVALHTLFDYSDYYTVRCQFSTFNLEKKMYTGQAKFTQAPPVVPVTNIRYGPRVSTLVYFDAHRKNYPHGHP